jgi:hypothetical protein
MVPLRQYRRRWSKHAALGVTACIVTALLVLWSYPKYPDVPNRHDSRAPQHSYQAGGDGCSPDRIAKLAKGVNAARERANCANAEQEEQRAQEAASEARYQSDVAKQTLEVARYQGWVFWWQATAATGAFAAAIFAVLFAKQAAFAADKTLEQSRISTEVELRSYIYPEFVNIKCRNFVDWSIYIKIKNFGNAPAHDVNVRWGTSYEQWLDGGPTSWPGHTELDRFGSLPPTDYVHFEFDVPNGVNPTALTEGTHAICIDGVISYRTVFAQPAERQVTLFRFYFGGDDDVALADLTEAMGAEMSVYQNGNDAT